MNARRRMRPAVPPSLHSYRSEPLAVVAAPLAAGLCVVVRAADDALLSSTSTKPSSGSRRGPTMLEDILKMWRHALHCFFFYS